MGNSHYLKKYVQMHPDNKMGWYLLGKEYEKNGQHGKANYCFNQSGGVFEAFETSKMPSDIWQEYENKLLQQAAEKDRRALRIRRTLVVMLLMLLALIPSVDAPGLGMVAEKEQISDPTEKETAEMKPQITDQDDRYAAADIQAVFTAAQEGSLGGGNPQIEPGPFTHPERLRKKLAVLEMQKKGDWLMWSRKLPLGYTLKNNGPGALAYQSYNPKTCNCQPADGEQLAGAAYQWTGEQEEQALLSSAIQAYKNNTGSLPGKLEDLLRPFPGNWISGTTDGMKEAFQPLLQRAKTAKGDEPSAAAKGGSDGVNGSGPFANTWGNKPFFEEPLKIIVDTSHHRLAVVSGRVILRNYKVGLGGTRTPEGRYVITDKVMNPNGRSDGEFGSRGMQLSGTNYAIHGTNDPSSIGADESQGCVRMSRADVEELFDLVPMGTPVIISKGGLPEDVLVPEERFHTEREQDQTNPRKTYHWL